MVLTFGVLSGLSVVTFTWISEWSFALFKSMHQSILYWPLIWTPLLTGLIVWLTRVWAPGCAGSGIPQVIAALSLRTRQSEIFLFASLKITIAKILLSASGLLAGLSLGREGPSVQVGAGVMHAAKKWLPQNSGVSDHGLLIAGGSAGIAAAFNTPLGGIMFAIEELSKRPEQRSNGLLMAAIVLAGLMGISIYGNSTYFGVIQVQNLSWQLLLPGLAVTIACGLMGGLFSRLLVFSLSSSPKTALGRFRSERPIKFAMLCALAVAIIGVLSHGATFGSGYEHTRAILEGHTLNDGFYTALKFLATWLTAWSGVPGGIFAPALSIGSALGADIASLTGHVDTPALVALGMAGFLAAVTQAPMTSFIIVMEMVDGYNLVLSLMTCAMMASAVSRLLGRPLYSTLAHYQLQRLHSNTHNRPPRQAHSD